MTRTHLLAAVLTGILAVSLTACGSPAASDAAAGACPQDNPDCVDTPQLNNDDPMPIDETGIKQLRRDARFYLGLPRDELPDHIRIARIDDEHMALTEDYRIGRITVELDTKAGTPIVTTSTVELPNGPKTFTLNKPKAQ